MLKIGEIFKNSSKRSKIVAGVSTIFLAAFIVSTVSVMNTRVKVDDTIQEQVSEFNCGLDNGELYVEPINIKTEMGKYDSHVKLPVDRKNLVSIDNYNDFTFVTYKGEDSKSLTELLISDKIPEQLNIKGLEHKWYSSSNSKVLAEGKSLKGMKSIGNGYLYMALTEESTPDITKFQNTIEETAKTLEYSKHSDTRDVIINIDGIGRLDLAKISVFNKDSGIYYGKDKVLRLYNADDDIAYIWITHINNNLMMNAVGNLEKTDYNNVYVDKDYRDSTRMGYKTYAIMTNSGMYSVKFNEKSPEGLEDELLRAFNINKDDAKIELPFKLNENK